MDFNNRFLQVFNQILENNCINEDQYEKDFSSLELDSITFIKLVVALESEFDFEFDDEMLLITVFPTVRSMYEYVESKIISCEST